MSPKRADENPRQDRELARWEAERRHRLDLLVRLSENYERGGSQDPHETRRMGAEANALITALGPDVLPELFGRRGDFERTRRVLASIDPAQWDWRHRADAVAVALYDVANERPPVEISPDE